MHCEVINPVINILSNHYRDESILSVPEAREYKTRSLHPAPTPEEVTSLAF